MKLKKLMTCLLASLMVATSVPARAYEQGWNQTGNEWIYVKEDGSKQTGWMKEGNCWYYFKDNGVMYTGWLANAEHWYYLGESGVMQTSTTVIDNGNQYYLKSTGVMARNFYHDGYEYDENGVGSSISSESVVYDGNDLPEVIEGNLYITDEYTEVELEGIKVLGNIVVQSELEIPMSVTLKDVTANGVSLQARYSEAVLEDTEITKVTVEESAAVTGESAVETVEVQSSATQNTVIDVKAEEVNIRSYGTVVLNEEVTTVSVGANTNLEVNADIETITVAENASESVISVSKGTTVGTVKANAPVTLEGKGTVEVLEANVDGITAEDVKIKEVEAAKGVEEAPEESKGTTGGVSGGSTPSLPSEPSTPEKPNEPEATVTNVKLSTKNAVVIKTKTYELKVTVEGENNPSQEVIWDIEGNTSSNTTISNNVLTIGSDETAEELLITATSKLDPTKSDSFTTTVIDKVVDEGTFIAALNNPKVKKITLEAEESEFESLNKTIIINTDLTILSNKIVVIPEDQNLVIHSTVTNEGIIDNKGNIIIEDAQPMMFRMRSLLKSNNKKPSIENKLEIANHGTIHAASLECLGRSTEGSTYLFWNSQVKVDSKTLIGGKGIIEFEKVDNGFSAMLGLTGDGGLFIQGYNPMKINTLDINSFADEETSNAFKFLLQARSKVTISKSSLNNIPANVNFSIMQNGSLDVVQEDKSVVKLVGTTSDYILQPVDLKRTQTNNPRINFSSDVIKVVGQYYLNGYLGEKLFGVEETNTNEITSITVTYAEGELNQLADAFNNEAIVKANYLTKYWYTKNGGWTSDYMLDELALNQYPIVGETVEVSLPGYSGNEKVKWTIDGIVVQEKASNKLEILEEYAGKELQVEYCAVTMKNTVTVQDPVNEELHCDNETEFRLAMLNAYEDVVVDEKVEIICKNEDIKNYDIIRFDSTKRYRTLKLNGTIQFDGNVYISLRGTTLILGKNAKIVSTQDDESVLSVFNSTVLLADDSDASLSTEQVPISLINNRFVFENDASVGSKITINKPEAFKQYFDTLLIRERGTQNLLVDINECLIGNKFDAETGKNIPQDFYLDIDSKELTEGQMTPKITFGFSDESNRPIDSIIFEGNVILKKDIADNYVSKNGATMTVAAGTTFIGKTFEEDTKLYYDGEKWSDVDVTTQPVIATCSEDLIKYINNGYKDITVNSPITLEDSVEMATALN